MAQECENCWGSSKCDFSRVPTVFPVWTGLVATVLLTSLDGGETLFHLRPDTLAITLVGHVIFGVVVGLGFMRVAVPLSPPPTGRSQSHRGIAGCRAAKRGHVYRVGVLRLSPSDAGRALPPRDRAVEASTAPPAELLEILFTIDPVDPRRRAAKCWGF